MSCFVVVVEGIPDDAISGTLFLAGVVACLLLVFLRVSGGGLSVEVSGSEPSIGLRGASWS